jgi:hypothetical protein
VNHPIPNEVLEAICSTLRGLQEWLEYQGQTGLSHWAGQLQKRIREEARASREWGGRRRPPA